MLVLINDKAFFAFIKSNFVFIVLDKKLNVSKQEDEPRNIKMNFRRLNSFLKNTDFTSINSNQRPLSTIRPKFKYENDRILHLYQSIKAKFIRPTQEKHKKIHRISNVFAYSRKSQDSNMAKLINLGNTSRCESTRNVS